MSYVPYRTPPSAGLRPWLPPVLLSALLWWTTSNPVSTREFMLSTLMLVCPWYSYCLWQRSGKSRVPLFALLSLAYWAAFAMPLFFGDRPTDPDNNNYFSESIVFETLEMAVLGVAAMAAGMLIPFRPVAAASLPDVAETKSAWRYLYIVMALGTVLSVREEWINILGGGGRQLLGTLATIVPVAICAMLATKQIDGLATSANRQALNVFVVARIVIGIASGWLAPVVFMGVILTLIYLSRHRRLPVRAILIVIPVVLFLQAGKNTFRERYWSGGKDGTVFEKVEFWLSASVDQWSTVFNHHNRAGGSHEVLGKTIERVGLLSQAANVMAKTPRPVPFQDGASYSYLAATLIPRAVWPNKPSVNDANRFYQVAYGLTSKEDLEGVSIAVGCLTEAYMNFSWAGVAGIMFLIGFLLGLFDRTLLSPDSGLLFCGVGLGLLSTLLSIESQAAQYLGGLLQQIGLVFFVVLPVIRRRKPQHEKNLYLSEPA